MTPREGVEAWAAACLLPSFKGPTAPAWARRWVEAGVGGFVLFATNVRSADQLARLSAELRELRDDTIVAVDEEGGDVTRLFAGGGSPYPGPVALGHLDDLELTRRVGQAIGAELRAAGVNLNLAPVADVNSNPRNPVIGIRAFGPDPERVAAHVAAFVEGQQAAGVAACAKHFPGHGDTAVDSHLALPTSDVDAEELEAGPLVPFRAAIAAGTRAIMTAHVVVPALDDAPATLSPVLLTGWLRERLGFEGTVISDALDMGAISEGVGVAAGAIRSLAAGADALCLGPVVDEAGVEAVHRALVDAVRAGRLSEERLHQAATRVRRTTALEGGAGTPDRGLGRAVSASAMVVDGQLATLEWPVDLVLARTDPNIAAGPAAFDLGDALRAVRPDVRVHRVGAGTPPPPLGRSVVLVLRDACRFPWQQELAETLHPAVVVETGLPGYRPPAGVPLVTTHGAGRGSLEAAASLLAVAGA